MVKEVIAGRKKSARWFSTHVRDTTSNDFEESNLGHRHFIAILENVLEILSRCEGFEKPGTVAESKNNANDNDPLASM